jgi:hypothetical protein
MNHISIQAVSLKDSLYFFELKMNYKSLLIALLLSLTSLSTYAHDYHASITDVKYNPRTQSLEVAVKVFTDDLEEALSKRNKSKVTYDGSSKVQKYLSEYLQHSLSFETVKGKPLKQNFIGSEEELDAVWVYLEVPVNAATLSELHVKNAVLTELFSDQMNIVNVTYKGKVNSVLLQKSNTAKRIAF